MKLSICFMTGRLDPHLDWVLDALAAQKKPDDQIEIIAIDALANARRLLGEREHQILDRTTGIRVSSMLPKPNIWQGPHRVTDRDWWATSNARNTFLCLARFDYVAFLDDRARLGPRWLDAVRSYEQAYRKGRQADPRSTAAGQCAEDRRDAVCVGSYDKLEGDPAAPVRSQDHRRGLKPNGQTGCTGGWLYGCTFALPLSWAIDVNGFEEGCDGLTGEDYIFGLMLQNTGRRLDFVPALYVEQDRTRGNESAKGDKGFTGHTYGYACKDKGISPNDKSHAALARFGKRTRTEITPNLADLRARMQSGDRWPIPDPRIDWRDWYDGELVRDTKP